MDGPNEAADSTHEYPLSASFLIHFAEAAPGRNLQRTEGDKNHAQASEQEQPVKRTVHETITMKADAQHVDAKPAPTRHDISDERAVHESTLGNQSTPARMQD